MKKRLFCLFLALALLLGAVPAQAGAAGTPTIRCGSETSPQQGYVYFPVEAQALENLAALELTIYYDPQVLEFQYAEAGWLLSEQIVSIHQETGSVTLTAASVTGISGDGSLMYMGFTVRADCAPGRYPLVLAVGEAYDTGRNPISIAARNGSVTVTEYAPSYSEFRLGMEPDHTTLAPGEVVTVTVNNAWWCSYASFDLSVHYDASLFRLVSATVPEEFERQNAVYSLNTATDGLVRLSCACVNSLWEYNMLELKLQVREEAEGTTALTAEIRDVYDSSRFPYLPSSVQTELTLISTETVELPRLWLEGDAPVIGETTRSTLILGEGSGLAAADFELRYDPSLLECLAVESAGDAQFLLVNPNFSEGTIRFSFVEETGVTDEMPLVHIQWRAKTGADRHYSIETTLIDPVDADFRPVAIDCPVQEGCVYVRETIEPTCEEPGGGQLRCVSCGDLVPVTPLPPLGHAYGDARFDWADDFSACSATRICSRDESHVWQVNCTVTHVSEGASCTEPGSITYTATADFYGEIYTDSRTVYRDELGHDYAWTVITEPGCVSEGQKHGKCIRCGDTCTEPIAPLGHSYRSQVTEPTCTESGVTTHTCTRCGDTYTEPIAPLGHSYRAQVTEPTCTEPGFTTHTCTRCGDHYQDQPTDPAGHDWSGTSCRRCGEKRKNPFTDVPAGSFYHDPVIWAVENGITSGTSETTFGPGNPCNRAQVVTFLWSAAGRPEPSSKVNPFTDVPAGCWYEKPVLWALEMGITSGTDATHFSPGASCNRATVVTFLWHAKGDPAAGGTIPFTDVPAKSWFTEPVRWALEQGITSGLSATQFGAASICNRAQVVTFLYKAFA